jgi:hypothetical protein
LIFLNEMLDVIIPLSSTIENILYV